MKFFSKSRLWLLAVLVGGLMVGGFGFRLLTWQDAQTAYYNAGLTMYQTAQDADGMKAAIEAFDRSVAVYKQRARASTWAERFLYPAPSKDAGALRRHPRRAAYPAA